jgi:hypothetical protein
MNVLISTIGLASAIFLIYALLRLSARSTDAEPHLGDRQHQVKDAEHRQADEPALPETADNSWRLRPPEPDLKPNKSVTSSRTSATDGSRCPACGASITANDERCPSCDIRFVAYGSQKWRPKTVEPADGIYRPSTEVSE